MRRRMMTQCMLLLAILLGIASCAKVPKVSCWRPWVRVLPQQNTINPGSSISVIVNGECPPLPGNNSPLKHELKELIGGLLQRRGFVLVNEDSDYQVKLTYKIVRNDMIVSNIVSIPNMNWAQSWGQYGYGITAAHMVSATTTSVTTQQIANTHSREMYNHALSLEVLNRAGDVVWEGEASWDSAELNLLWKAPSVLQLLASALPKTNDVPPKVKLVKVYAAKNFYRIYCRDIWFSCPALPYRIAFEEPKSSTKQSRTRKNSIPKSVKNPEAFATFLDLIKTAEFALPMGTTDYSDPLDTDLWTWVSLGREYLLMPGEKRVPILIELRGTASGYEISECKIATPSEYQTFLENMDKWQNALTQYFDVYE